MNLSLFIILLILSIQIYAQSPPPPPPLPPINVNVNSRYSSNLNKAAKSCQRGDCYPETGDLLLGRTKFLHASSTCGLTQPERYCVLGTTKDATKCFVCDSSEPYDYLRNNNSHTIDNIVSRKQGDRFNRWWQSENGKQDVYIQFDLEAEFVFTHIIMTFKTFRPAAMVIEKSSNFGRTWKPYGYFAYDCASTFPDIPTSLPKNLGDVYCESKYSSATPSTKGEAVFRILPPTLIQSRDPYSAEIQDLLKITNLRVNLTKLHTFGDDLLDSREELKEKYYYALYEMVVRGSCFCHGHASRCIQVEGVQYDVENNGMVHGQCECQHHTSGINCEQCLPLYNDRPWMPARSGHINECRKCQCNGHARSCRFDENLYNATNGATGGICEECQHSTEGVNCEKCKKNYWRDPKVKVEDQYSCKPCLCDLKGSLNDAECDPITDEAKGLEAGKCHCKTFVEGPRCDRCKNGYFNLDKENPDGCQPCDCSTIGTSGNLGCDKISGLCTCKEFVAGRACDQCKPGYFGLSEDDPKGCKPCDCSLGGSYNNSCDIATGQCYCRPNMVGRTCDKPLDSYYCPTLDHLSYEAEDAEKQDQLSQNYQREIYSGRKQTWTGNGYVRVYEGASLEFTVNNIFRAGSYELVLRYECQNNEPWEDVRVKLIREDGAPDNVVCTDYAPQDDEKAASLPASSLHYIVQPPSCLEPNKRYKFKIDFVRSSSASRNSSLLFDSIILVPVSEELIALQAVSDTVTISRLLEEFNYYGCKEAQINIYREAISDNCAKFICNIGNHAEGALSCDCNPTGSSSTICEPLGGTCQCKPNVVGRKCDRCAPGTWGYGPNGCQPCNCNSAGAKNNFCNVETGECECFDDIDGKKCDQCKPNHWRFPSCEKCQCNGFADSCDQVTGNCINCRNNTQGTNCESCKDGYYGKPTEGQVCKECMCPGGRGGNQFASTCYYDQSIEGVVCNCKEGYIGARCDRCAINYYGNPLEIGGSCTKCECNGNTDENDATSCDQQTGQCRKCLYNTAGDHCEVCRPGFYGNASNRECRSCNCNPMGTEGHSEDNCDAQTGQCRCLQNVEEKQCVRCKEDHYGLATGEGCSYCTCDSDGTRNNSTACDLYTGQCDCLDSRGGRTCSECSHGYWGDPNVECKKCTCNMLGSVSDQCDKINGTCICRKGITGYNCDKCDRGTTGDIPFCKPCGECFDDWSDILKDLYNQLETLEEKASNLAVASGSSVKDFTAEYSQLEDRLNDIKKIIASNFTDRQLKALNDMVVNIEKQIAVKKEARRKYYVIEKWNEDGPQKQLESARAKFQTEKSQIENLTQDAIDLKESTESGATESIYTANRVSDDAERIIEQVKSTVENDFNPLLNTLIKRIESTKKDFEDNDAKLKDHYQSIISNLESAVSGISNLNGAVCGEKTTEKKRCNDVCGGAGCDGKCGTNTSSCGGLMDSYNDVMKLKETFDNSYNQQETIFKRILTKLRNSSNVFYNTNKEVNNLLDYANKSLQSINNKRNDLNSLVETIDKYVKENSDKPVKIEDNCNYILNKNIELKESDLEELLSKINDLASKINVGDIETETEIQRQQSQELLKSAEKADSFLPGILAELNRSQNIYDVEKAKRDQINENYNQIEMKNNEIIDELETSNASLTKIGKLMSDVRMSIDDLKKTIDLETIDKATLNLIAKQESLKSKVKESDITLKRTSDDLIRLSENLNELTKAFQSTMSDPKGSSEIFDGLIKLQTSINEKKQQLETKQSKLQALKKNHEESKKRIRDLKEQIKTLKDKAINIKKDIQNKEKFFNSCS